LGSPELIELPVLNELLPESTCAGTRLRRTGTRSYSFFFSRISLSTASVANAVTTVWPAAVGCFCTIATNLPNCRIRLT
jgi:hypothetical protein